MPATAPAAPNGNTVIRVGVIESVEDGIVFVETLDGSIPVHLTSDSIIQEFADGPLGSLAIGQRVTVIGQETEAGITLGRL